MNNKQSDRVRRLRENGFSVKGIIQETGYPMDEVLYVLSKPREPENPLLEAAHRMLKRVPEWAKDAEAYRHCVQMNFKDVLG